MQLLLLTASLFLQIPLAFAAPDMQGDCRELGGRFKVPQNEMQGFTQFCVGFSKECYAIEDRAADGCGIGGSAEQGAAKSNGAAAQTVKKDGSDYQAGTQRGIGQIDSNNTVRQGQISNCRLSYSECTRKNGVFAQSQMAIKPMLECKLLSAENAKWSPSAKGASSMCETIRAEMARVVSDAAAANEQKNDLQNIQGGSGVGGR